MCFQYCPQMRTQKCDYNSQHGGSRGGSHGCIRGGSRGCSAGHYNNGRSDIFVSRLLSVCDVTIIMLRSK